MQHLILEVQARPESSADMSSLGGHLIAVVLAWTVIIRRVKTFMCCFLAKAQRTQRIHILTLAEALRTQRLLLYVGATLVANCWYSQLRSLLQTPVNLSAFFATLAPLRETMFSVFYSSPNLSSCVCEVYDSAFFALSMALTRCVSSRWAMPILQ